jgi:hypothetical protein
MKKFFTCLFMTGLVFFQTQAQAKHTLQDTLGIYFSEIKETTSKHYDLWGMDLYGPILFVNPQTRELYANMPDSSGLLKQNENIFTGRLPTSLNISNTSINWSGRNWAMVMLPLPKDKTDRLDLIIHELFHKAQPALGFTMFNPDNNHLDEKNGRIYLRLELEALKQALQSTSRTDEIRHLTNAVLFRKYRYSLYPHADSTENRIELNEGLAEYTGLLLSNRTGTAATAHFIKSINSFLTDKTFVRSFPYETLPVYGYLLNKEKPGWNKSVTIETDLTGFMIDSFGLQLPADLNAGLVAAEKPYNAQAIILEETQRDAEARKTIATYKSKFIDQPHTLIVFEKMSISYDYRTITPLEDKGTVYPQMRITDNWGILTVNNGGLLSPSWDRVTLSKPQSIGSNKITGDGWVIDLSKGYAFTKDESSGNYRLTRE